LIMELEQAMCIVKLCFYLNQYIGREPQIELDIALGRCFHGSNFLINPTRFMPLAINYWHKHDNIKRENVTNMFASAVLSLDNYYAKKQTEEFIIDKLH